MCFCVTHASQSSTTCRWSKGIKKCFHGGTGWTTHGQVNPAISPDAFLPWDVAAIPHTPSSRWEPTVCSRVAAPINLHMQSGSDTSEAHPSRGACALGLHTHSQCSRRWPFFLVDQMATWQLQQMPHQWSHCAEAAAFSFPLLALFLSTPPKPGPV